MQRFYIVLKNGSRTAYLAGPFALMSQCEALVCEAHDAAIELDAYAWFYEAGVLGVETDRKALPPGVLNRKLGLPLRGLCDFARA